MDQLLNTENCNKELGRFEGSKCENINVMSHNKRQQKVYSRRNRLCAEAGCFSIYNREVTSHNTSLLIQE